MSELHYAAYRRALAQPRTGLLDSLAEAGTGSTPGSREQVLRELLDEAHARIRALESALQRSNAVREPSMVA
jgi:hypothetical protein